MHEGAEMFFTFLADRAVTQSGAFIGDADDADVFGHLVTKSGSSIV
jgi:hypothetical protein